VDRYDLAAGTKAVLPGGSAGCLVGLSGSATVRAGGEVELQAGKAVVVPTDFDSVTVASEDGASFVRCFEP
jgi:hypothetical protein